MSHAETKSEFPPMWFCDLVQRACDKYTEVTWGEDPWSSTPDNARRQPTRELPTTHCYWLVTAQGIEVFDGDDLSLETLERVWPLQAARQAVLLNMYPGVVGREPSGLGEWNDWAEPRAVRLTGGALEGEVFGPLFGWEAVEDFMTLCEDAGAVDEWSDFEPVDAPSGGDDVNPYTRLRDLIS